MTLEERVLQQVLDGQEAIRETVLDLHVALGRMDERSASAISQLNLNQKRTSDRVTALTEDSEARVLKAEERSERRDDELLEAIKELKVGYDQRFANQDQLIQALADQALVRKTQFKTTIAIVSVLAPLFGGVAGVLAHRWLGG